MPLTPSVLQSNADGMIPIPGTVCIHADVHLQLSTHGWKQEDGGSK